MKFLIVMVCVVGFGLIARAQQPISDPNRKPLKIDGVRVALERDAKNIAFEHFVKKMNLGVLANEGVREISIFRLGYDVPEFAAKGDVIWQAIIKTLALGQAAELRGIIWIHPETAKVHFVTGAWENKDQEKH